jgi:hypothetical protein
MSNNPLLPCPHAVLDRLKALRGAGESYGDVILRIAKGETGD